MIRYDTEIFDCDTVNFLKQTTVLQIIGNK